MVTRVVAAAKGADVPAPQDMKELNEIVDAMRKKLGNSILQSGAAIGAILTPLIVQVLVVGPGTWNRPFLVVGVRQGRRYGWSHSVDLGAP